MITLTTDFVPKSNLHDNRMLKKAIKQFDSSGMLGFLREFPEQVITARKLKEKPILKNKDATTGIIFSGLGGSAICGDLFRDVFSDQLAIPVLTNRDYCLPAWVNQQTLAILISYSGNTEETLSTYREARKRKVMIGVVSSGGKLSEMAQKDRVPLVTVPAGYPPRTALGYLFFGALSLLESADILKISKPCFSELLQAIHKTAANNDTQTNFNENPARRLAAALKGTIPIIYSAAFLSGTATRWKTQIEENSKNLAFTGIMPEMNHNEVVGWSCPAKTLKQLSVLFLRDREDEPQVKKRFEITRGLLRPRRFCAEVESRSNNRLVRLFSTIVFGDWVSYYLALENKTDPTPVERITQLKKQLANQ
ncbi:MAG: bifunctional phosphoglucose/phosphomannose isomerase [Candidatus Omnitrophica bacterium]|nr:bifunctional phosphoglucose/phosphomannose isomerase [Candidatus Omnitrophota bacterium]